MASTDKVTKVTKAQEIFIHQLLKGKSQREAFLIAYPRSKKWKMTSVDCEASKMFRRPPVNQRYEELLKELRENELLSTQWSREAAIKTLRDVIEMNKQEIERINAAYDEELEILSQVFKQAQDEKDGQKMGKAFETMLKARKSRRVSNTYNQGIITAVSELNKMQGFHEETINLNGSVIFSGETELED